MLITDPRELSNYTDAHRLWQGIPSIAVTKGGAVYVTFYSGGIKEDIGNYTLLYRLDAQSMQCKTPLLVAYKEGHRCFDPCLFIDPLGRLWLSYTVVPSHTLYVTVCDDPDAENPVFSEPRAIGRGIMMNKPTVLKSGEWLFPVAIWARGLCIVDEIDEEDRRAFVYRSCDHGKTFKRLGGVDMPSRLFDEHMTVELRDGRLMMLVRTTYGIGVSYSYDGGVTWTDGKDSTLGGPSSRFHIRRLKSGRILLINHVDFTGRNNLTACLSEDDGKTYPYRLLLDGRSDVSYPDAQETDDGYIHIVYDRERGGFKRNMDEVYACSREILYARITEEDILRGKLVSEHSTLAMPISKLGKYAHENDNPFGEVSRYTDEALAAHLMKEKQGAAIVDAVFDAYPVNCTRMQYLDAVQMDALIARLELSGYTDASLLVKIIGIVRRVREEGEPSPIVLQAQKEIAAHLDAHVSLDELARTLSVSKYYFAHLFKRETGISVLDYRNALRMSKAKQCLAHTKDSVTKIAADCGYDSLAYFGKIFAREVAMSPSAYRKLHFDHSK